MEKKKTPPSHKKHNTRLQALNGNCNPNLPTPGETNLHHLTLCKHPNWKIKTRKGPEQNRNIKVCLMYESWRNNHTGFILNAIEQGILLGRLSCERANNTAFTLNGLNLIFCKVDYHTFQQKYTFTFITTFVYHRFSDWLTDWTLLPKDGG